MSSMLSCWRENAYEDKTCKKEIERFLLCAEKVVGRMLYLDVTKL